MCALWYESSYAIENQNEIIYVHDNEVENIFECNLLHEKINPPKRTKNMDSHYSPILCLYMNTRKGRTNINNFRNLLDGGCSSTIVIRRLVEKICTEKDSVMQWQTQA